MVDPEQQRQRVEVLKRKLGKSPGVQNARVLLLRPEAGETDEKDDALSSRTERKEGDMWEARSQSEVEADERASEDGERRLAALEFQLRAEEEQRELERARLRAEELKKRSREASSVAAVRSGGAIAAARSNPVETRPPVEGEVSRTYSEVLHLVYRDGRLTATESEILGLLRKRLGITEDEHLRLQQKVQLEVYSEAMVRAWHTGVATQDDFDKLDLLREQLNISAEEHLRLERQVRRQMLRRSATAGS
jgi:hypothetical protein